MHIGIPKEIKDHEFRVAATPSGVAEMVRAGHRVSVEAGAGAAIGFDDAEYARAGAALPAADGAYAADLVFKVRSPSPPRWNGCVRDNGCSAICTWPPRPRWPGN